ncbi:MAG: hypothetical protein SVX38_04675 [Chloroflexota bacterium]|nr:hypothetical protein [Chloroflexota bacterium]
MKSPRSLQKWVTCLALLLLLSTTVGACQSEITPPETSLPGSMKGYELYSWQTQGDWYFALVVGTNRIKTHDEISSPEVRLRGIEELKRELDRLSSGEQVFWSAQRVTNTTLPPAEIISEVRAYCRQRGIQLEIEAVANPVTDSNAPHVRDGYPYPVTTIAVDGKDMWVGSGQAGGGAWRYDGKEWEVFTEAGGFPIGDDVQILRIAPDGSVWAGAGCQVARFADGVWERVADCKRLKGKVTAIAFTPDGATWVASALELSRFDGQTWIAYGKLAHHLAVGTDGVLWVSGWEGLQTSFYIACFDGTTWTTYNVIDLLGHGIGRIAVTPDGDVWGIAGEYGVARYDGQTWRHYTDLGGFPGNEVRELVVGPDGVLWAVGSDGLAYFDGDRWVSHKAGVGGNTLAFGQDGDMWVAAQTGVVHLLR